MADNQVLYITPTELAALVKQTQQNGETLETQFGSVRPYVTQTWAVEAVLQMRSKR